MRTRKPITTCGGYRVFPEPAYRFSGSEITPNPDFVPELPEPHPYDDLGDIEGELHQDFDSDDSGAPPWPTQSEEDEQEQKERELDGE